MKGKTEMTAHTLSRRNRPGRCGPRRALALAATAMLVAACGGNSPPSAAGSAQYQKALAFSKCMRSHGALGFPDPTSQGTITVTQAMLNSTQIRSAGSSCKNLLPRNAVQLPPALERKLEKQALQYAACMRSHGVPSFPDPTIHNGTVGFHVAVQAAAPQSSPGAPGSKPSGSGPKPSSGPPAMPPQFQAAQRACQNLMPGSG
jgi:hypothetical protein